jgi:hypothetical protein
MGERGTREGYHIVKTLTLPQELPFSERDEKRLARAAKEGEGGNHERKGLSAAVALNLCYPDDFPSISSARKAIRRYKETLVSSSSHHASQSDSACDPDSGEVLSQHCHELNMSSVLHASETVHLQVRMPAHSHEHSALR